MEYVLGDKKFHMSYQELKESYLIVCDLPDSTFLQALPEALHLACIICYLKEIPSGACLCDTGIIHELTHLMVFPHSPEELARARELFKSQLQLA